MSEPSDRTNLDGTTFRVGLIVDGAEVSKHVADIAAACLDRPELELAVVIVSAAPTLSAESPLAAVETALRTFAIAQLRAIEAESLRRNPWHGGHVASNDLSTLGAPMLFVRASLAENGYGLCYTAEDCAAIAGHRLDILVRCGNGEPAGDVLAAARFGALAMRFGESASAGPVLSGFDEVVRRAPETRFSIIRLRHGTACAETLWRGDYSTQGRWLANEALVCAGASRQLLRVLIQIARGGEVFPLEERSVVDDAPPRLPSLSTQARYATGTAIRILGERIRNRFFNVDWEWSVGYVRRDWREAQLAGAPEVANPPGHFFADPFVVHVDGETVIYVEDYVMQLGRGVITALRLDANGATQIGVALNEPFHLSFPFLFKRDGALFMIPESSAAAQIRLYRCHRFPLDWRLEAVLMDGVAAVDTMVFARGGRWWMLTCLDAVPHGAFGNELHVFSADQPDSTSWEPHRANPVMTSVDGGRNGGVLRDGPELYRVGQKHGFLTYGEALSINQIVRLDDQAYAERRIGTRLPDFRPDIGGVHHMHSDGGVTVFDYRRLRWRAP